MIHTSQPNNHTYFATTVIHVDTFYHISQVRCLIENFSVNLNFTIILRKQAAVWRSLLEIWVHGVYKSQRFIIFDDVIHNFESLVCIKLLFRAVVWLLMKFFHSWINPKHSSNFKIVAGSSPVGHPKTFSLIFNAFYVKFINPNLRYLTFFVKIFSVRSNFYFVNKVILAQDYTQNSRNLWMKL